MKEILNFNILSQFRDKNEIVEYLKNNNFDEKDLQILIDKFKNKNNNLHNLNLEQLDKVAAGLKDFECKVIYRSFSYNEEYYSNTSFAQRSQIRLTSLNHDKMALEHFNSIEELKKDNCTFDIDADKYVCFPNGTIVRLNKDELKIFREKTKLGVHPQVAAAYALNGIIEGIPKVEYPPLASVTQSFISFENGRLVIKYKSLYGKIVTQDDLIDSERNNGFLCIQMHLF